MGVCAMLAVLNRAMLRPKKRGKDINVLASVKSYRVANSKALS
jgi:hypothetical protein